VGAVGGANQQINYVPLTPRFERFSDACTEGSAKEQLVPLFEFLRNYIHDHFLEEEKQMSDNNFPHLDIQKRAHAGIMEEFSSLQESLSANDPDKEIIIDTKRVLIQWLIKHIRHMDGEFGEYLTYKTSIEK
jgi:hemerythrin-like metal-binding protein